jgi:SPP1 family holin
MGDVLIMKLDRGTVARAIVFLLAWINSFLASKGLHTIPVLDEQTVAMFIAFGVSAYTFYKHNFFGKTGQQIKDAITKELESLFVKEVESKIETPAENKPENK